MKVNENNSDLADYSKRLDKKLVNQTLKKENEIENIKKINDKQIEEVKNQGETAYVNALKRNDDLLTGVSKDYEEKLNKYKSKLEETHKNLTSEENALREDHSEQMKNYKTQSQNSLKDRFQVTDENQRTVLQQAKNSLNNISNNSHFEINRMESLAKANVNSISQSFNKKEAMAESEFRDIAHNELQTHQADLLSQRSDFKKNIETNSAKNKRLESEKLKAQTAELNYRDNHQKDILSQKQTDFAVRYENLTKEHDSLLANLKKHFDEDVKKMFEENSSKKRVIASKSDDQFYRIETLNPKIVDSPKEFFVSLAVPEHEKENVHLSVQGRNVKMTLTRKYSESMEAKDGTIDKSNRNELFSKEFPSKDLLNQKQVVQKYENGILSFKIQKL
jgi:HSP20 family molecular chaperone IbpA